MLKHDFSKPPQHILLYPLVFTCSQVGVVSRVAVEPTGPVIALLETLKQCFSCLQQRYRNFGCRVFNFVIIRLVDFSLKINIQ